MRAFTVLTAYCFLRRCRGISACPSGSISGKAVEAGAYQDGNDPALEAAFEQYHQELNCLLVEPLLQGADGMRMYDISFLQRESYMYAMVLYIIMEAELVQVLDTMKAWVSERMIRGTVSLWVFQLAPQVVLTQ